jgi:hypothetical protein
LRRLDREALSEHLEHVRPAQHRRLPDRIMVGLQDHPAERRRVVGLDVQARA